MSTYSRYDALKKDGAIRIAPFVKIPIKNSDRYEYYEQGISRLDVMSYKHYKDPNYGWLILLANPEVGSLEFNIPTNTLLRIPYPLDISLYAYEQGLKNYDEMYGID